VPLTRRVELALEPFLGVVAEEDPTPGWSIVVVEVQGEERGVWQWAVPENARGTDGVDEK
jgi:hypothetical protein